VGISGHSGWVTSCVFSYDGTLLATSSEDRTVKLWDVVSGGTLKKTLKTDIIVRSLAFSPDGLLVMGMDDGAVRAWDLDTFHLHESFSEHSNSVRSVAVSGDKRFIAAVGWDTKVVVWDTNNYEAKHLVGHSDWVECVAFSPDSKTLATGGRDNTIVLWDSRGYGDFTMRLAIPGHTNWVTSLSFSTDGTQLVSTSYDKTVRVWNAKTGKAIAELKGHTATTTGAAFTPNGKRVLSVAQDSVLHLWDHKTGEILSEFVHSAPVSTFAFGHSARLLASGDSIGNIYLLRYNRKQ